MNESFLLRFESEGRPLNVVQFSVAEGVVFDQHRDASPLNIAIGLQPLFPTLLDFVRRRHDWRNREFFLDAVADSGGIRFSGFQGDREGLPQGVYDLTVEVESYDFRDASQRMTVRDNQQTVVTVHEQPDLRRIRLRRGMDTLTSAVLDNARSVVDGIPLRGWLASSTPRPARQACLLNLLAKMRVPPDPARGLSDPLLAEVEYVYFADVDRAYAAARPGLHDKLEQLAGSKLWVKEGPPAAAIHRRLLDTLTGVGVGAGDASRFELTSYRQGGRNCLQIVTATPPPGFPDRTLYADVDIDLGNPLWDLQGLLIHAGEVLDSGRTDHLKLHATLNRGETEDFLYYDVVMAERAGA